MFVRIRGKGASPENSQAALMHLRGFRHANSAAPAEACYAGLLLPPYPSAAMPSSPPPPSTSTSPAAAAVTNTASRVEMRPFRFSLFPFGIHAAVLTKLQTSGGAAPYFAKAPQDVSTAASASTSASFCSDDVMRMVWKETWNLYDVLYDEVPLLPWTESADDVVVAAVTNAVERELAIIASGEAEAAATLHPLSALIETTDGFVLPSARAGNQKAVVCAHYYASAALPEEAFCQVPPQPQRGRDGLVNDTSFMESGPVIVLDLTELPLGLAGGKAMLNIAWYVALAGMPSGSTPPLLLRCRAVVVRLPYASVPTYDQARTCRVAPSASAAAAAPTMADAFCEAVDFIGEHITAVYRGLLLTLQAASAEAAAFSDATAPPPPVVVVGSTPSALGSCLCALLSGTTASTSATTATARDGETGAPVVIIYGDHLGSSLADADTEDGRMKEDVQARQAPSDASYGWIAAACGFPVRVETLVAPLKALLDDGEEPWDAYTLRERTRLNYCPCCGDCAHAHSDSVDQGDAHGHGHHHH